MKDKLAKTARQPKSHHLIGADPIPEHPRPGSTEERAERERNPSPEAGIRFHYDLPPEFFRLFLDRETMSYSCAYFRDGKQNLGEAQRRKLDLVSRKLDLQPGDRVLDIGLGWGNMALNAAQLGCRVVGMTLAPEQARYVREEAKRRGLGDRLQVLVEEARSLPFPDESFDKVVTIGATEHIDDLGTLFREVARVMTAEALFLQHAMTQPAGPEEPSVELDFLKQHIFPVGRMKTLTEYAQAFEEAGLEVIDVHNITDHYTLTLHRWLRNLEAAGQSAATALGVSAERYRAQLLFLAGSCVSFAEGRIFCYQELLRKIDRRRYRRALPAGRDRYALDDGPSQPLPAATHTHPLVEVTVEATLNLWIDDVVGSPQVGPPPRRPDCRLTISRGAFAELASGELSLVDAYLGGLIDIEGDPIAALQLRSALLLLAQVGFHAQA